MTGTTLYRGIGTSLDEDTVEHYHRQGWALLPGLLTGDALAALQRAVADASARPELSPMASAATLGVQRDQGDPEYQKVMSVLRNVRHEYPELDELARGIGAVAARLIGRPTRLWGDRVFSKPRASEGSRPTQWHQDLPKLPLDRRGYLTIWIAVEDVTLDQGPLTFVPGSHRLGPLGAVSQMSERELDVDALLRGREGYLLGEPVTNALRAGDATVHDGLLLHRAGENRTERVRRGWAVSYLPADTLYTGGAQPQSDGLGLGPYQPFDHELFPIVG